MAVKSVIEIDVQDDAFKAFVQLFEKYQAALKKTPGVWNDAATAANGTAGAVGSTAGKITANINFISKQTEEQAKMRREVERTNRQMTDLGRSTLRVAAGIKDITFSMLRWGTLVGAFSLLTGAGGLFGYSALASSTSSTRRSALELGVTSSQLQAANITYERIGGAGNLLSRIAEIREDVSQRYLLEQLGVSPQDITQKDAADLLPSVIEGLRRRYLEIPEELRTTLAPAYGLTQFAGLGTLRLLGGTSAGEISELGAQYGQRRLSVGANDETGRRFADFMARLEAAGAGLKSTLADRLVELSVPINNVIDAFTNLVKTGINTPEFERGIKTFAEYIQEFSLWLGSEKGRNSIREFAENVGSVVSGLGRMAAWLASWFPAPREAPPETYGPVSPSPYDNPALRTPEGRRRGTLGGSGNLGGFPAQPMSMNGPGVWGQHFSALEGQYGLPPGLLNTIYQIESGGGRNLGPSRAGALGPFQFMPDTARSMGLQDPMDTASSAHAAARYMDYLLSRFSGDLEMAAASYNWGEGNVRRQVARLGPRWREGLPDETRNYINRVMTGIGPNIGMIQAQGGQNINITIQNATGSNTVNTVTGLAAGGRV